MADDNKKNAIAKLTYRKEYFKYNPELVKQIDLFIEMITQFNREEFISDYSKK